MDGTDKRLIGGGWGWEKRRRQIFFDQEFWVNRKSIFGAGLSSKATKLELYLFCFIMTWYPEQ